MTEHDPILAEIVSRLVEAYQPQRIYLFGSMARGDAGPDSDYDLMVIVPDDAAPERQQSRLAYDVLRGTGTAADVLVWSPPPPGVVAFDDAMFHAQQLAEKALKAFLTLSEATR